MCPAPLCCITPDPRTAVSRGAGHARYNRRQRGLANRGRREAISTGRGAVSTRSASALLLPQSYVFQATCDRGQVIAAATRTSPAGSPRPPATLPTPQRWVLLSPYRPQASGEIGFVWNWGFSHPLPPRLHRILTTGTTPNLLRIVYPLDGKMRLYTK